MREYGALRAPRCAAGVEQPCGIFRPARRDSHGIVCSKPAPFRSIDHQQTRMKCDGLSDVRRRDHKRGLGVIDDVVEFVAMQLGVHRHRNKPGMPNRDQRLQIGGVIGHGERNPLAGPA